MTRYADKLPITAIAKVLAPKVDSPPWASRRACRRRTMKPATILPQTPSTKTLAAIPTGWELVPAIGTGIGTREMRKIKAVIRAKRALRWGSFIKKFLTPLKAKPKITAVINHQKSAHLSGNIPSLICIA